MAMRRPAPPPPTLRDALAPVRDALLRAARHEADAALARADEEARCLVARARAEAEQIRAQARAHGLADSAELVRAQRSRAGRQARAVVLDAQRSEYEALRCAAREAVAALCEEPSYADVRRRMTAILLRLLGDGAQVRDAPGGGLTATVPGRSADFSLARLADRAVDAVLAADSEESAMEGSARMSEVDRSVKAR